MVELAPGRKAWISYKLIPSLGGLKLCGTNEMLKIV